MKRLILTGWAGASLEKTGLADVTVFFMFKFGWGELPTPQKLTSFLAARSDQGQGEHWSDYIVRRRRKGKDLGLAEFCELYDEVELWFDPTPTDQLQLIWLLDFFSSHPSLTPRLTLRLLDVDFIGADDAFLAKGNIPVVPVTTAELETASLSWQAYRSDTPEACSKLLQRDLTALPLLKPTLTDLLRELPGPVGLGATELRLLELVGAGYRRQVALFYHRGLRRTRVFSEFELGYLLDGLAHGPVPALEGLDETRTLSRENLRDRVTAYQRCQLSITDFGRAVLRYEEDFSRHNPIDRWWGGTHLTNDRMWRWNPTLVGP
jgi:hypothetical protein